MRRTSVLGAAGNGLQVLLKSLELKLLLAVLVPKLLLLAPDLTLQPRNL
jgi:hypothetical protein